MTGPKNSSSDSEPDNFSGKEKRIRYFIEPFRLLIDETKTLPGKLNVGAVFVLAVMLLLAFLALLGEMTFELELKGSHGSFSMGGDPLPPAVSTAVLVAVWLAVSYFCARTYKENG